MAEPLDYYNSNARSVPVPRPVQRLAPVVVPADFDTLLTRTEDVAAARAIEVALRRGQVDVFTVEQGEGGAVELYVRRVNQPRAAQLAARIFARRRKIKSFPRQETPRDWPDDSDD
jgi:hypothetical protein